MSLVGELKQLFLGVIRNSCGFFEGIQSRDFSSAKAALMGSCQMEGERGQQVFKDMGGQGVAVASFQRMAVMASSRRVEQ